MTVLVGTGRLVRLILRRDRIRLPVWIAFLGLQPAATAAAFSELYPSDAARGALAASVAANPAFRALFGPLYGSSLGAITVWRLLTILGVVAALMSIFTVVRHTRAEEEAGRRDLLGSTVVGRQAPLTAALLVAVGANIVVALVVAGGLIGVGLPATGSFAFGLAVASVGFVFAAVAAMVAQLTDTAGSATGISLSVLGLAMALRIAGDSADDVSWLSWLSPLGWSQRIQSFADERWWVLALAAVVTLALVSVAYSLSARRDVGSGVLPVRPGPAVAAPGLSSPLALAWRLQRGRLFGWTVTFAALGFLYGGITDGFAAIVSDSPQLQQIIEQLGGQQRLLDNYFSAILGFFAVVVSAYTVDAALRLRSEEGGGRAEPILATGVARLRWESSHLVFALLGPVVLLAVAGLAMGVAYGMSTGDLGTEVPRLVGAALVHLPAVWVLTGTAAFLFGLLPQQATLAWAVLAGFFLVGVVGPALGLDQWVIDLSPFAHIPAVPAADISAPPLVWLLVIATALIVVGLVAFRRRDLEPA